MNERVDDTNCKCCRSSEKKGNAILIFEEDSYDGGRFEWLAVACPL